MASPINTTGLGCAGVLAVIVGLIGFNLYQGHQRVIGLDALVAEARASANAEHLAPSLKATLVGTDPDLDLGKSVGAFLSARLTQRVIPLVPPQSKAFTAPIAIVDLDGRRIDPAQGRLPSNVRAPDVRGARTLVFVRCFKTRVGEYGWLQGAYRRTCDMAGFDMRAPGGPALVATASFDRDPPETISSAEIWYAFHDVVAGRPSSQMASYAKDELGIGENR